MVEFDGVSAQHVRITVNSGYGLFGQFGLSEVQFFYIPTFASRPSPADGASDVAVDETLSWGRSGRGATEHNVLLAAGADELALAGTATESSLDSAALDLATTYSWRVDEVIDGTTWTGDVWTFSTVETIGVDDMEGYKDEESFEIWITWVDGFGDASNGALVGNGATGSPETVIVHGGGTSLPLHYGTEGVSPSEAKRTFDTAMDWAGHGIQGLVLYFHGSGANTGGDLYVKINNTKVAYDGGAAAMMRVGWNKWYVPLAGVATNLGAVSSLTLGVDGGAGVVYVDDIHLTGAARQQVTPVDPGTAGLLAHYKLDGDATDSSGNGLHGAVTGEPQSVAGQVGSAMAFDGVDDHVDLGSPDSLDQGAGDWTVSAWIKIASTTGSKVIFSKGGDGGGGHRYMLSMGESNDHKVTLTLDENSNKRTTKGGTVVDNDEWHHVLGQRVGTELQVYVDASLDGTQSVPADYSLAGVSQANAFIGCGWHFSNATTQKFFPGTIDEVRVYNRAMSEGEVNSLAGRSAPFDI